MSTMDIFALPSTRISDIVEQHFLEQLARKVQIEESATCKKIQIIIFLPIGRPGDEFENTIDVFNEKGGNQEEDTIFITVLKKDRKAFVPPETFTFVLNTTLYLTDAKELDSSNDDAINEIAGLLIDKYGFKKSSTRLPKRKSVSKKVREPKDEDIQRTNRELEQMVSQLKSQNEDIQRKNRELEQMVSQLKSQNKKNEKEKQDALMLADRRGKKCGDLRKMEQHVKDQQKEIRRLKKLAPQPTSQKLETDETQSEEEEENVSLRHESNEVEFNKHPEAKDEGQLREVGEQPEVSQVTSDRDREPSRTSSILKFWKEFICCCCCCVPCKYSSVEVTSDDERENVGGQTENQFRRTNPARRSRERLLRN